MTISDDEFLREFAAMDSARSPARWLDEFAASFPQEGKFFHHAGRRDEIRFNRSRGYPFVLIFAFPPIGPMLYSGSLDNIRKGLLDVPTHHGFEVWFTRGWNQRSGHGVSLFGKNAYDFRSRTFVTLKYRRPENPLAKTAKEKRSRFYLDFHSPDHGTTTLHTWRKLPKAYLKQLKDIDEVLEQHERKAR